MTTKIFFVSLFILAFIVSLSNAIQDENMVALYLFDDENGDEVIDLSGNENHGTFQGDIKRVNGIFGGGLEFNGVDTFVEIPDSESLMLTNALTIAMWINLKSYSTAGGTGVTKETSYKAGTRSDKKMMFRATTAGGAWGDNVAASESDVPLNEWHHVAATYDADSGDALIYLDGKEDRRSSFSGEITSNTSVLWLGRGQNPFFEGIYDEVAIWNVALSEAEIAAVMNVLHNVKPGGKLTSKWGRIKADSLP
ncbi:hypothetical protein GF312_08000 [Candidatus Poribacteria bacterium]|nr:hypothetical protein [Candidatus Poribacteria bacterium]